MHTKFGSENLKRRDVLRDLGVDMRIIFKRILKKSGFWIWTGFIWTRTGSSGGLL
jgi:hypothetical protein